MEDSIYGAAKSVKGWWIQGRGGKGGWKREREREKARRGVGRLLKFAWIDHDCLAAEWARHHRRNNSQSVCRPSNRVTVCHFDSARSNGRQWPSAKSESSLWSVLSRLITVPVVQMLMLFFVLHFIFFLFLFNRGGTTLLFEIPRYYDSLSNRVIYFSFNKLSNKNRN